MRDLVMLTLGDRIMRFVPVVVALLTVASPAFAAPHQRPSAADAVKMAQEPLVQDAAADTLVRLADIILDTRVGPAAALADPNGDVRPNDTLRDLKRRDDPRFEQHLRQDTRRAVGTATAVAGGAAVQAQELKRTADRLDAALTPLIAALGTGTEERN